MSSHPRPRLRPALRILASSAAVLALAACTGPGSPAAPTPSGAPWAHAHGIYVSPDRSRVLVATHTGLFDYSHGTPSRVGAADDYMGLAGDGTALYASGHPGPGSSGPNPLGLIRSTDGGKTWEQLSGRAEHDFHALALTRRGVVGFDGQLLASSDLRSWTPVPAGPKAAALAGRPDTATVLATTEKGVQRSVDGGRSWAPVPGSPIVQFAALASPDLAAGIAPDGTVYTSADAGAAWTRKGTVPGEVEAMTATADTAGRLAIWAVTDRGVLVSDDGGTSFAPYTPKG